MLRAIRSLAHALDAKDSYTWGHSKRVSVYSIAIACELGLSEREQATLALGGELHDIGKIGIPDTLLNKPAPLTADEYRDVMQHTVIGERILQPLLRHNSRVLGIVRWHHEHVGGGSLPDGLAGDKISLEARIVSVADAFDAMTSDRPYRLPMSAAGALRELELAAGTQFDEDCVDACAAVMHDRVQAIAS
jgi:HD-GYP domain-containing protein (c-di-GMP phosphodiesterase class II)